MLDLIGAERIRKTVDDAIGAAAERSPPNVFSDSTDLWKSFFKHRATTSDLENLLNLLNSENTITYGVANKIPARHKAVSQRYFEAYLSKADVERFPIPLIGNPTPFVVHDEMSNISCLQNAVRTKQILEFLHGRGLSGRKLRVAEIGAGYGGMAQQLIAAGVVSSYTIIDLPINLRLSAFYLTALFGERFKSHICPVGRPSFEGELTFVIPNQIELLEGAQFDLVINCDSLGEMPAVTAQNYVKWISEHLASDGIFYSKNGHRRSEGTTTAVSDYGYDRFRMLQISPTEMPSKILDHHSHVVFLARGDGAPAPYQARDLDTLCELIRVGLHNEVRPLLDRMAAGTLTPEDRDVLDRCRQFFDEKDLARKASHVQDIGDAVARVGAYLAGLSAHAAGHGADAKKLLKSYIEKPGSPAAEAVSRLVLMQYEGVAAITSPLGFGDKTAFLLETAGLQPYRSAVDRKLLATLRNPLIAERVNPFALNKPTVAIRGKNLLLNVMQGKGLSTQRLS